MKQEVNPVMAMNPYTEKLMNIEPLFNFLHSRVAVDESIDAIIRVLVLSVADREKYEIDLSDFDSWSGMYSFVYELRDLFKRLGECEISIPKKKGA